LSVSYLPITKRCTTLISEHCLRRRWLGDPLCDNAVKFLNPELKAGQDIFGKLIAYVDSTPKEEWDENVKTFWDHIAREPPEGISAFPPAIAEVKGNAKAGDIQDVLTSCDRRPKPTVAEGQAVFWRYSAQLFSALFHFSLAGGTPPQTPKARTATVTYSFDRTSIQGFL
jgi:hypothetical protein